MMKNLLNKRHKDGFTLIEMLLVVMVLGIIMAIIAPKLVRRIRQAGEAKIKFKLQSVKEGLTEFKMEFGRFPTTKEGLRALVENPYPNDPNYVKKQTTWPIVNEETIKDEATQIEFTYHCPPEKYKWSTSNSSGYRYFEIIYLGPSQTEGDPESCHDGV